MTSTGITFIGGPTVLLEWAGLRIVTDPTFDPPQSYPDPGRTTLVKTTGPALSLAELGQVDLVLLSHHDHKDNLDYEGLELIASGVPTLSTQKASSDLFGGSIVGLDAWETFRFANVTITTVPALHGGPGSEPRTGPVMGFVLEAEGEPTVYISGDNASVALVEQIAQHFTAVDVAILFAGAARITGVDAPLTLTAAEAVAAARALRSSKVVVVHTEDWSHFSEDRAVVTHAFRDAGLASVLVATPRGKRVKL